MTPSKLKKEESNKPPLIPKSRTPSPLSFPNGYSPSTQPMTDFLDPRSPRPLSHLNDNLSRQYPTVSSTSSSPASLSSNTSSQSLNELGIAAVSDCLSHRRTEKLLMDNLSMRYTGETTASSSLYFASGKNSPLLNNFGIELNEEKEVVTPRGILSLNNLSNSNKIDSFDKKTPPDLINTPPCTARGESPAREKFSVEDLEKELLKLSNGPQSFFTPLADKSEVTKINTRPPVARQPHFKGQLPPLELCANSINKKPSATEEYSPIGLIDSRLSARSASVVDKSLIKFSIYGEERSDFKSRSRDNRSQSADNIYFTSHQK